MSRLAVLMAQHGFKILADEFVEPFPLTEGNSCIAALISVLVACLHEILLSSVLRCCYRIAAPLQLDIKACAWRPRYL